MHAHDQRKIHLCYHHPSPMVTPLGLWLPQPRKRNTEGDKESHRTWLLSPKSLSAGDLRDFQGKMILGVML